MNIFKMRTFKFWEIGLLKLSLISFGIILGLYFYEFLATLAWLWWIIFIIPAIYFIAKYTKD